MTGSRPLRLALPLLAALAAAGTPARAGETENGGVPAPPSPGGSVTTHIVNGTVSSVTTTGPAQGGVVIDPPRRSAAEQARIDAETLGRTGQIAPPESPRLGTVTTTISTSDIYSRKGSDRDTACIQIGMPETSPAGCGAGAK